MNLLEVLLKYQETDMEVDGYELELKKSPLRQKLVKLRNYLATAQKNLDEMESELENILGRMDEIKNDVSQVREKEAELSRAVDMVSEDDETALLELLAKNERLVDDIEYYEKLLEKTRDEALEMNSRYHDIKSKALKAKSDFTQMKAVYDKQYSESGEKLDELKKKRDLAAEGIDKELLERYKRVKSHRTPPMALLRDDQCMGCNMSLPAVVMRSAQQGEIIECENCGRILYTVD